MTTAVCHACVMCILLCVMQKAAVGCIFSHDNSCMSCRRHLCDMYFVTQQLVSNRCGMCLESWQQLCVMQNDMCLESWQQLCVMQKTVVWCDQPSTITAMTAGPGLHHCHHWDQCSAVSGPGLISILWPVPAHNQPMPDTGQTGICWFVIYSVKFKIYFLFFYKSVNPKSHHCFWSNTSSCMYTLSIG